MSLKVQDTMGGMHSTRLSLVAEVSEDDRLQPTTATLWTQVCQHHVHNSTALKTQQATHQTTELLGDISTHLQGSTHFEN